MITDNLIPMLEVNQWVEAKSLRKTSTGKEYAGKLVVYLNYLDEVGVEYHVATNKNVKGFIHNLIYGGLQDLKIKSLEAAVFYPTLSKYVTVITELYKWLDNNYETSITFQTKTDSIRAKKSFLYGQIYSYDYKYIVDRYLPSLKGGREYIKWYEDGEKAALCSNFSTLRDEAVFRVTLEGFRIDEVLSMRLGNYNPVEQVIQPSRSKGRQDVRTGTFNHLRTVALPAVTCEVLNKYIQTERMIAENQSGIISNFIFLNTQKDTNQGKPLSYSNYYKIFKRCAIRAGINPDKVRTHSGRSTKVMEFIEHQILHPEDGITDAIIMESFGWRNDGSIASYRNHNNQVIAKEIMRKLHKKKPLCNGGSSND
jgi:site-specific recombinase XerD